MKRTLSLPLFLVLLALVIAASWRTAADAASRAYAPQTTPTAPPVTNTITLQVQTSTDDTSVRVLTNENLYNWAYLRIGYSKTPYINGIRFQDVQIPPGSQIVSARLLLYNGSWHKYMPIFLTIQAEANDSPLDFANANPLVSERPRTSARVRWEIEQAPPEMTWFESPEIRDLVQEIINRPGWRAGNALAIILESAEDNQIDHYLDALSYDFGVTSEGAIPAPKLEIVYFSSTPIPTSTPTLTPTPTITPTPEPGRLAIEQAEELQCNARVHGDTRNWGDNVQLYTACRPVWPETGPEAVYRLELPFDDTDVLINLYSQRPEEDLDVFLLSSAYPEDCLGGADASLLREGLDAGVYYVAVDGYDGAADAFTLMTSCRVHFANSLYLPVIRWKD
ncbi:MAG TPA: hypothetical protein EYP25_03855 [Anaerolineae bacterium]|nr:hypothetical protein [Anaerolineae bacterium]